MSFYGADADFGQGGGLGGPHGMAVFISKTIHSMVGVDGSCGWRVWVVRVVCVVRVVRVVRVAISVVRVVRVVRVGMRY